jgi:hypothetical protein
MSFLLDRCLTQNCPFAGIHVGYSADCPGECFTILVRLRRETDLVRTGHISNTDGRSHWSIAVQAHRCRPCRGSQHHYRPLVHRAPWRPRVQSSSFVQAAWLIIVQRLLGFWLFPVRNHKYLSFTFSSVCDPASRKDPYRRRPVEQAASGSVSFPRSRTVPVFRNQPSFGTGRLRAVRWEESITWNGTVTLNCFM